MTTTPTKIRFRFSAKEVNFLRVIKFRESGGWKMMFFVLGLFAGLFVVEVWVALAYG